MITSEVVKTTLKNGDTKKGSNKKIRQICQKCKLNVCASDKFCPHCGSKFAKNL